MNYQDNILNKLTVIIPTFNRNKLLHRLLSYYAACHTNLRFIILDSSDKDHAFHNKNSCLLLEKNIQYYNFPSTTSVSTKLLAGLKLVDTPYCAFCADDDLVFVEGLLQASRFLENNLDYSCVDGIYLNFNTIDINIYLHIEYATNGIQVDDPGQRIFRLYQKYESLFYGVFRTLDAVNIFSNLNKIASLHYQELFQATATLLLGKSYRLPIFYAARQHCEPADPKRDKWQTYYWFAENPLEFLDHYVIYRNELWNFYINYIKDKKYSKEVFFKILDISHAMYFGIGCPPKYFYSVLKDNWQQEEINESEFLPNHVYDELKNKKRLLCEYYINKLAIFLHEKNALFFSWLDMKRINKITKKTTNINWKCNLDATVKLMVSSNIFCQAYLELCRYLSMTLTENRK